MGIFRTVKNALTHKRESLHSKSDDKRWLSPHTRDTLSVHLNERAKSLPADVIQVIASFLQFDAPCYDMIFACGGRIEEGGVLSSAEMFDTWHGVWVDLPNMHIRRAGTSSAPLEDKRFIVTGGYDEGGITFGLLKSCEIYDPLTRTWEFAADMVNGRWGHGTAALKGNVYVVGGCSIERGMPASDAFMRTINACEVYDPHTNTWREIAPMQTCRAGVRIVAVGSNLIAVGGCSDIFGRAEILNTVEIYNTESGTWSVLDTQLAIPRTTAAVASIGEGQLFVAGGAPNLNSCEVVDLFGHGHRNSELSSLRSGRMGCQSVTLTLPEDCTYVRGPRNARPVVVVLGGEDGIDDGDDEKQFETMEIFDIKAQKWTESDGLPPMKTRRTAMAVCVSFGMVAPVRSRAFASLGGN